MSQSPRSDCPSSLGGSGGLRNLDNFLNGRIMNGRVLTSPRSLEVCNTHGVKPEELLPRSLDSFQSGGVPKALVQRRWEHHDEKRSNILNFLRGKRHELIENPVEDETPRRATTPRAGSYQRSASRCSTQRNRDLQQRNYEEKMLERDEKYRSIDNATAMNIAKAELSRLEKNDMIRQRGEQRWNEVSYHRQQAKELFEARQEEERDRHVTNELKRETSKTAANTARSWRSADLASQNSKSLQAAQERARQNEEEQQHRSASKWQSIEEKSANAIALKDEQKAEWMDRGYTNAQLQAETRERAEQLQDETIAQKYSKLGSKEQRYREHTMSLEEQRSAEREARQRETERYLETVDRGNAVLQAKTELKRKKNQEKEARFLTAKEELEFEKLLDREIKREKTEDHIEVVTRMRRAREYQREKYMRAKCLNK